MDTTVHAKKKALVLGGVRVGDTVRVMILELQELDCPLDLDRVLDMGDFDVSYGERPSCWRPPSAHPYTDEQKDALMEPFYRNAYEVRATDARELIESLYDTDDVSIQGPIGTPVSFDPKRKKMLCATFLRYMDVDAHVMTQDFLDLKLSHAPTSNDKDRTLIIDFVRKYGSFVPFDSFTPGHLMTVDDMIERWAQPDMERQCVLTKTKDAEWDSRSVFAPYRNLASSGTQSWIFHGRFLMFFEAFAVWHEVSSYIFKSIEEGNPDYEALAALTGTCAAAVFAIPNKNQPGVVARDGFEAAFSVTTRLSNMALAVSWNVDDELGIVPKDGVKHSIKDYANAYRLCVASLKAGDSFSRPTITPLPGYESAEDPYNRRANRVHGDAFSGLSYKGTERDRDKWKFIERVDRCIESLGTMKSRIVRLNLFDEPKKTLEEVVNILNNEGESISERTVKARKKEAVEQLEKILNDRRITLAL